MADPLTLALVGAGGSILGGLFGSRGASDAAEASARASDRAVAENRRQFDALQSLNRPLIDSRDTALSALDPLMYGDPQAQQDALRGTPGYQFAVDEGERGTMALRNATGNMYGGGTALELQRQRMGLADQTYNSRIAQLMGAAGLGTAGSNEVGSALQNFSSMNSQLTQRSGDAQAAGILGRTNSIGNTLNNLGMLAGYSANPGTFGGSAGGGNIWGWQQPQSAPSPFMGPPAG